MGSEPLSPQRLIELSTAFRASKTLAAAHELDLFGILSRRGGATVDEVCADLGVDARPAGMLLAACASLGLLEVEDGRYRNAPVAEEFLVGGRPGYLGGWIELADRRLYAGWGRLAEAIRRNRPTTWDPDRPESLFEGEGPEALSTFWEASHAYSVFTARALAAAVDFGGVARLLDVGGGSAAYDVELCRRYPGLRATVYDLPFVCRIAARKIREAGLADRIAAAPGDFLADEALPHGHDCVLLSNVLGDWDEATSRTILRKCRDALPAGGLLVVGETLLDDERSGPPEAALRSLNLLVETEGGRCYTPSELAAWLADLGFCEIETVRFEAPGANGAVTARVG